MLKIRALNRDSLSDEDAPTIRKEAQVIKSRKSLIFSSIFIQFFYGFLGRNCFGFVQ